jgi:ubiquinone/menaquinone biosynthesis C-methylase UbiE
MTYGEEHGSTDYTHDGTVEHVRLGSREFFENADETFYRWNEPLHGPEGKFSRLFDFERYRGKKVLEVGCGIGCMAMNWAQQGAKVTAVDLNPVAVEQTRRRFQVFDLEGDIREADGENLPFAEGSFDFAYSWGVLHHTPGTKQAIGELYRVLKPGGRVGVMLYNRRSFLYRFIIAWQEGFVNMERCWLSELELASRYADGDRREGNPHTWPVTRNEVHVQLFQGFANVDVRILGTDIPNVLNIWSPELGTKRMNLSRIRALARRWGWSLWIAAEKPA